MTERFYHRPTPPPNKLLALALCGFGIHKWFEWKLDFFEQRNVYEQCEWCGKRRIRWDKRKYRRLM